MVEFTHQGTTINSKVYCKTLNKFCRANRDKRRAMLKSDVMLLHDNARPHAAARTRALL
jgi:hypothetical protein